MGGDRRDTCSCNHYDAAQEKMAGAAGYGNAVAPAPTPPEPAPAPTDTNSLTPAMMAAIAATVEAVMSHQDQGRGTTSSGHKRCRSTKYCWTHGYVGHTSKECHSRRNGHDENASSHVGYKGASDRFYEEETRSTRK